MACRSRRRSTSVCSGGRARDRDRAARTDATTPRPRSWRWIPRTGQILAMAGGRDWNKNKVNYATGAGGSGRQSGSAFKAFTLAAAMQQGYDLNAYWNGPSTIGIPQCPDPTPAGRDLASGERRRRRGRHVHAARRDRALREHDLRAGDRAARARAPSSTWPTPWGSGPTCPMSCSITLGSVAVNPLEMTNAYATLADQGVRHWATPLLQVKIGGQIDDSVASQGDAGARRERREPRDRTRSRGSCVRGPAPSAAILGTFPVAGKTGTANENVDAWFCGYTVQIVTCVWMGWPTGRDPAGERRGRALRLRRHDPGRDLARLHVGRDGGPDPRCRSRRPPSTSPLRRTFGLGLVARRSRRRRVAPSPTATPTPSADAESPEPTPTPVPTDTPSPTSRRRRPTRRRPPA